MPTAARMLHRSVQFMPDGKGGFLRSEGKTHYAGRRAEKALKKAEKLVKRDMMKHGR